MGRYQKGRTNLDFTTAGDSEWQWHQLGHMQVCTSLQTGNQASTPLLSFYRPDALPAAQPTASKRYGNNVKRSLRSPCSRPFAGSAPRTLHPALQQLAAS